MGTLLQSDSRRLYSWWWNSHISPKSSKWLHENLADMDAKVNTMIKLIEEDADSFAMRAEMYYKRRPELMKLVEEFYRTYRALAERYDHATRELRQVHHVMARSYPNSAPFIPADDPASGSSTNEGKPCTPERPHHVCALFDHEDFHQDVLGLSTSHFHGSYFEDSDAVTRKKGLKQLNEMFGPVEGAPHTKFSEEKVRKRLKFPKVEEKEEISQDGVSHVSTENQNLKIQLLPVFERSVKAESKVQTLEETDAKLEAKNEAGLSQNLQSLVLFSELETQESCVHGDSRRLNDQASNAETEFETLEEYINKLQTEREACCLPQNECLSSISNLEAKVCDPLEDIGGLNERAIQAETEVQNLKQAITTLVAEKETAILQCNECLGTIPNLEEKISQAEEESRRLKERADKAEREVETLKQALCDLNEEKEATAFQYQHCLETISKLETEVSKTQDEANMLNGEIEIGVAKLNNAKKQCLISEKSNQSLPLVVENLVQLRTQNQELLEKQQELGRILIQMQEHLPFLQADTAFQTLQYLHSQSQEEQKYLVSKLQDGLQMLTEMELQNQDLEDEIWQIKEKNKSLNELTFSSSLSKGNLHDKILSFRDRKVKLEEQVEFQVDQKNAFKKDVYGLKEEINVLNNEYQVTMEQLNSAGLKPECLVPYVKGLWDENLNLKEISQKDRDVKKALQDKLKIQEKLVKKNTLLETSLSDADAELEGLRKMVKILEESFQSLLVEKSNLVAKKATLVSQLVIFTKIMGKLSKKNRFLEILLTDRNTEHERLRAKSRKLEESWQFLDDEKSGLVIERDNQIIQLKMIWQKLEYLEKGYTRIEERCSSLEEEKESTLCQVEELRASLDAEKKEHASLVQLCETQLSCMKNQICHQKEGQWRKQEFEEELDKAVNAQIKTYILQECFKDVEEKNFSLLIDCQKNFEASKSSDKLITRMEQENLEQQIELKFLLDHIDNLRTGINQVLKAFEIEPDYECEGKTEQDQEALHYMIRRIEEMKNCVLKASDEKWQLEVEKSVLVELLEQLRLEAGILKTERNTLHQESKMGIDQLLMLEIEKQELLEMNRKLRLEVTGSVQQEALLRDESKDLCGKLLHLQGAYMLLQSESVKMLEKNIILIKKFTDLREETCMLEQENVAVLCEAIALSNLSVVFKSFGTEKAMDLKQLCEDLDCLQLAYSRLENKAGELEGKLEVEQIENSNLKESVKRLENELDLGTNASDQLNYQVIFIKDLLNQKKMELSEVEQKLKDAQGEIMDLQEKFQGLNREYDEATTTKEDRERRILKLSEDNTHKSKEIECLTELNRKLESELDRLYKENAEIKSREVSLCTELQESSETKLWETSAVAFYFDLQLFTIHESLYQEKIIEMIESFESLKDENISKNVEIEQLNERAGILEGENGRLKFQLATYLPVILSLRESIISLEQHPFLQKKPFKYDNQEPRDAEVQSLINNNSSQDPGDDQAAMVPDGVSAFQELQSRVAAVAAAVTERERLVMQESLDSNIKLEVAMKEIEELKSKSIWFQGNDAQIIRVIDMHHPEGDELGNELSDNLKLQSTEPEICEEEDGLLLKDIRLDQISECSAHGVRRMKNGVADDHLLELWETAERNHILNLLANKGPKLASAPTRDDVLYHHIPVAEEQKSSELQFEKELGVDKLVVSSKVPHQELNNKTLRRLTSNAQNLENLQITVQDLKRKVEVSEKSIKGKDIEYDTAKKQLQEIEDAIVQSINVSGRLMKNIEDSTTFVDGKARKELEETENVQIRGVLEQARQGSEMIRWLQLEVQNIHFLLLKLDAEECRDKTKFVESNTILQGHFRGIGRSCPRPKKAPFCACMRPQIE